MTRHAVPLLVAAVLTAGCTERTNMPFGPATRISAAVGSGTPIEGNILIADQFNNRVIEVNPTGTIVWHFGLGPGDVSAASIIGTNDAERVGALTLMAGTGAPPGTEPLCPTGCADNRVMLVDHEGRIVWQYGTFGVTGADANQLNTPVQATYLPTGNVLITDQSNERIIEVERAHNAIVWQYGTTGVIGAGADQLNNPNSAELLANGHILISDENNNRAIEVDRAKNVVATFTAGGTTSGVAFSSRLANGHTLITDSNNSRIVEVDANDQVVWQYVTNTDPASNPAPLPTRAVRLRDGNTLISDQFNHRVIEVSSAGRIVLTFGTLNTPGFGTTNASQGLNGPYDAKVIGDFTGLTPPLGH
ncbi:MAG TPA: PQQ-binding-like beta-propeller repeat protein [Gemmatimonadales bacterium]|nr:PQQ-binding-like beta-propeller repeat protein [Gemmatimonadales bacterium]